MEKDQDKSKVDFATAVKALRENINAHVEYHQLQAKIMRAKFVALEKEGFTADQALALCRT